MIAGLIATIVCRTCGAEEGVFIVLRSEDGTTYECRACDDQRCHVVESCDSWIRRLFTAAESQALRWLSARYKERQTPTHPPPLGAGEEITHPPATPP